MQIPVLDIDDYINNTVSGDLFRGVNEFIDIILPSSQVLAGGIMFVFVAHKIVISFLKPDEPINPYTLVRPILILAAIALYTELVELLINTPIELVSELVEVIAQKAYTNTTGLTNWKEAAVDSLTHIQTDGGLGSGVFDLLTNATLELIHLLIFFLATVIVTYILMKQLIVKSLYLVLGVFVLPFSLIVGNEKALSKWFFGYLSVMLWVPILTIIMFFIALLNFKGYQFDNPLFSIAFQVLMIFVIFNVPKYANIIVGGEGSDVGGAFKAARNLPGKGVKAAKAISKQLRG